MATDEHHYVFNEFPLITSIAYRTYYAILAICWMDVVQRSYEPLAGTGVYRPFYTITMGCRLPGIDKGTTDILWIAGDAISDRFYAFLAYQLYG
jgi:hypothetical protein